jgi:ribosomal protein S18 acetylase RimI-like enzyme
MPDICQHRDVDYREATADDAEAIARLHADSWKRHYRGAFLDSYLDGDVVADLHGALAGFAHTILDEDPVWGAFLDNLHVRHDLKRHGIGAGLLAETARAVTSRRPASGLYLWVLEQNTAAQAFYCAQGGRRAERKLSGPFPGGGRAFSLRYAWADPAALTGHQ